MPTAEPPVLHSRRLGIATRPGVRPAAQIAALDGLRGIAIALVLAGHVLTVSETGGSVVARVVGRVAGLGWAGVDLFFVLSGFLITRGLLETCGRPGWLRRFYLRRMLRILPLYYATVVALLLIMPLIAPGVAAAYRASVLHSAWLWGFGTNVWLVLRGATVAAPGPIGHFWSLGVEEQFYLVWPALMAWLTPRHFGRVCVGIVLGGLALRAALLAGGTSPFAIFLLTPTRLDGFAVGGWLAVAAGHPATWAAVVRRVWPVATARPIQLTIGAVGWVVAMFALGGSQYGPAMQTAGFAGLAVGFGILLAAAIVAPPASALRQLLGSSTLRWAGRYSYGLYLLHPIVIWWLARFGLEGRGLGGQLVAAVAVIPLSAALAWAGWAWIERPALALKARMSG